MRSPLYAVKLPLLDRHAAPYPTAQVLTWLVERIDQILDHNLYTVQHGRKGAQPEAAA